MAWNEPGGGGNNKNPWGNGGGNNNDGPPDLDEVVRKMQEKFGGLFGKRGPRGVGSSGDGGSNKLIFVVILIALVVWVVSQSVFTIHQPERGVVLRFGKYSHTAMPGLNFLIPLVDQVTKVNISKVDTIPHKARMLTQDENIVEVELAVQFLVQDAKDYLFNVRNPEATLKSATESAVREVVGKSKMDFVITDGREIIAQQTKDLIQDILDRYKTGLRVLEATLQDSKPPDQVKDAFDDAIKAREDLVRYRNEAEAYSKGIVPVARGKGARLIEESNAYKEEVIARSEGEAQRFVNLLSEFEKSPEVTRERLYLDAIETVMTNSTKVMVDVKQGNNIFYLPLDRMIQHRPPGTDSNIEDFNAGSLSSGSNSSKDNLSSSEISRRRESR